MDIIGYVRVGYVERVFYSDYIGFFYVWVEFFERFEKGRGEIIDFVCLLVKGLSLLVGVRDFVLFSDYLGVFML